MKAIFLDRDGVLNIDRGDYTYLLEDFKIIPGTLSVLRELKQMGYLLIVVTNQAGIAKGLYNAQEVFECHEALQQACGGCIDYLYYAPWHPSVSESLGRKPGSLLFERAIARFDLEPEHCCMIGDKERDLIPAKKLQMKTFLLGHEPSSYADHCIEKLDQVLGWVE